MGVNGYVITTRAEGTVLTGFGCTTEDIFNGDHENHVIHTAADFLNSWEATLSQMQATHAPVTNFAGTALSLPASLGDENERIRYQLARIKQKMAGAATPPFWYTAVDSFSAGVTFPPTAARVEQTAAISVPNNTLTQLTFNSTVYDTAFLVQPLSLLRAPLTGVYTIGATIGFDNMLVGSQMIATLRITSGATTTDVASSIIYTVDDSAQAITVETVKRLQAGDTLKLMVFQNTGSARQVFVAFFNPAMWMSLTGGG